MYVTIPCIIFADRGTQSDHMNVVQTLLRSIAESVAHIPAGVAALREIAASLAEISATVVAPKS